MQLMTFNPYDDMATKTEKAKQVLQKLEKSERVEASCLNHESALEMAKLLQSLDERRYIAMIEVHGYFLRVYRADLNGFRFGAMIYDLMEKFNANQQPPTRP